MLSFVAQKLRCCSSITESVGEVNLGASVPRLLSCPDHIGALLLAVQRRGFSLLRFNPAPCAQPGHKKVASQEAAGKETLSALIGT